MLLDLIMPTFDVAERHSIVVDRDLQRTWEAVESVDLLRPPLIRVLLELRALPSRLVPGRRPALAVLRLADLPASGFVVLAEAPGREIVYGLVGPVWSLRFKPGPFDRDSFGSLVILDGVKIAFSVSVARRGRRKTAIATETRVVACNEASRRRFLRYWRVVGPFSGVIRVLMLREMRSAARRGS